MRIYCYVTSETCRVMSTAKPGERVWDGRPVSKHGDYVPWCWGRRKTLERCKRGGYDGRAARAVCKEMGWE